MRNLRFEPCLCHGWKDAGLVFWTYRCGAEKTSITDLPITLGNRVLSLDDFFRGPEHLTLIVWSTALPDRQADPIGEAFCLTRSPWSASRDHGGYGKTTDLGLRVFNVFHIGLSC